MIQFLETWFLFRLTLLHDKKLKTQVFWDVMLCLLVVYSNWHFTGAKSFYLQQQIVLDWTVCQSTFFNVPEDLNLNQHCHGHIKFCRTSYHDCGHGTCYWGHISACLSTPSTHIILGLCCIYAYTCNAAPVWKLLVFLVIWYEMCYSVLSFQVDDF